MQVVTYNKHTFIISSNTILPGKCLIVDNTTNRANINYINYFGTTTELFKSTPYVLFCFRVFAQYTNPVWSVCFHTSSSQGSLTYYFSSVLCVSHRYYFDFYKTNVTVTDPPALTLTSRECMEPTELRARQTYTCACTSCL